MHSLILERAEAKRARTVASPIRVAVGLSCYARTSGFGTPSPQVTEILRAADSALTTVTGSADRTHEDACSTRVRLRTGAHLRSS